MLTVLYSPHMTSLDNEVRRASGHADVPLSPLGRAAGAGAWATLRINNPRCNLLF